MKTKLGVTQLKCEYCCNPIGVDLPNPRLSWVLESGARGQRQTACRILVSASEDSLARNVGDMWDTGKLPSDRTSIIYSGKPLSSNQMLYWKVQVWDKDKQPSGFSELAHFGTALLDSDDWQAKWIGMGISPEPDPQKGYIDAQPEPNDESIEVDERATLLRREIKLTKSVSRARMYVCGLGFYELYFNGERVGVAVLTPAKTNYRKEVLYDTYDVTSLLRAGETAIGLMLGNGWYNPLKKWWSWRMQWFGAKRAMLQLHIEFDDGTTELVCTDKQWKASPGPVVSSCIYDGEIYDANLEQPGWDEPDFDDSRWENVSILPAPGGKMISQMMEPVKVVETIAPVKLTQPEPGTWVYDFGQNFAGWIRLSVTGPKSSKITLRYAENLAENGLIDVTSNNLAQSTDVYILKGGGREVFEPRFTYHGFRYLEMTGFPGEPDLQTVQGCVVQSACAAAGSFRCSDDRINRIHQCILWSQRGNMIGHPMDCPQRDERLGWLGDAHVTAEEAMHNFHAPLFYRNWLSGIRSNQNSKGDIPYISPRPFTDGEGTPAWSCGYLFIVWYHYLHYGDARILEENYPAMKRYVDYLGAQASDFTLPPDKYGDWASANESGWWHRGEPKSTATGFYFYSASLLSKAAKILDFEEDENRYRVLAGKIRAAYHREFFDEKTRHYESNSQFSSAFPLFLGIVPENEIEVVHQNLIDDILENQKGHLTAGILGTKYMMEYLNRSGRADIAYLLATQTGYPSWLDMLGNRTTLSEHWNQGGSNNHVMFGSIDTWLYRGLAGINPDENSAGYRHAIINPQIPPELEFVEASLKTVNGSIRSNWRMEGGDLKLAVEIPANCSATVHVLAHDPESVTESGKPAGQAESVKFVRMDGKHAIYEIGSGNYKFISNSVKDLIPQPFAATPIINPEDAFIIKPRTATIRMSTETEGAEIRYTLDGSEPDESSQIYEEPLKLEQNAIVCAKAFKSGYHSSFSSETRITFVDPERNGISVKLYTGEWKKLPDFAALTPECETKEWTIGLEQLETPKYNFGLVFSGQIEIPQSGNYRFFTQSNDGSRLLIDGKQVVDNDGEHGTEEASGAITLKAGMHPIELHYFQSGGSTALDALIEGPGISKQSIPAAMLFRTE